MKITGETLEKVKLMHDCEPTKLTQAVAMLERAKLAEKTSYNVICDIDDDKFEPCARLAIDDFIFYVSMLGYTIDTMSDKEFNKCKDRFIKNLQIKINSLRDN